MEQKNSALTMLILAFAGAVYLASEFFKRFLPKRIMQVGDKHFRQLAMTDGLLFPTKEDKKKLS